MAKPLVVKSLDLKPKRPKLTDPAEFALIRRIHLDPNIFLEPDSDLDNDERADRIRARMVAQVNQAR